MSTTVNYQMTREQRDLLTSLWQSDQATKGGPALQAEKVEMARDYLSLLLVEVRAEVAHVELLEELYRASFRYPLSRSLWLGGPRPSPDIDAGFLHSQLLPEKRAQEVATAGPAVLSPDELAVLLLNPYALWDLADLIDFLQPEFWLERMSQVGLELIERHRLEIPIHGAEEMPSS